VQDASITAGISPTLTKSAKNSPEEYDNLYACAFIKNGETAFDYNMLLSCGADGYDEWPD
jgi:hypothetical protein